MNRDHLIIAAIAAIVVIAVIALTLLAERGHP